MPCFWRWLGLETNASMPRFWRWLGLEISGACGWRINQNDNTYLLLWLGAAKTDGHDNHRLPQLLAYLQKPGMTGWSVRLDSGVLAADQSDGTSEGKGHQPMDTAAEGTATSPTSATLPASAAAAAAVDSEPDSSDDEFVGAEGGGVSALGGSGNRGKRKSPGLSSATSATDRAAKSRRIAAPVRVRHSGKGKGKGKGKGDSWMFSVSDDEADDEALENGAASASGPRSGSTAPEVLGRSRRRCGLPRVAYKEVGSDVDDDEREPDGEPDSVSKPTEASEEGGADEPNGASDPGGGAGDSDGDVYEPDGSASDPDGDDTDEHDE
jgi:hypothetical protein